MLETDLNNAVFQGALELKRQKVDIASPVGNLSTHYDVFRASRSAQEVPDTTFENLWICTKEHYGLTAAATLTGMAGIPISKTAVGAWVHVGSSKTTNLASYIGWRFFPRTLTRQPTAAKIAKATFGTVRVFGIIGRGIPFVAAGLAVFDLVSIGLCAYEARNGKVS